MKFDKSLIATLREDPKEAESKSHRILLRGGFIRQVASGIHTYLPLGWRILLKISNIIREEMDGIGGQELLMPAISPKELWEESGRLQEIGDDMFQLKDRKDREYCLCPTHEEIVADTARNMIRSYRDLPQIWYQIQTKFRDEPRPRSGVIRSRQFIMKDSYSLDCDEAGLDNSFNLHKRAYEKIFKRCGLDFVVVDASGGLMGTGESKEFMATVAGGEDQLAICRQCNYRANLQIADGKGEPASFDDLPIEQIATPEKRTVEEVTQFLRVSPQNLVKSIFFTAAGKDPVLLLIRGDYEISEDKIQRLVGHDYQPASAEQIRATFGAQPGYIGPVGMERLTIYADDLLRGARGMITGANRDGYHVRGLNLDRDVKIDKYVNIRKVKSGDRCPKCDGEMLIESALELGHIFKLGTKYSISLGANFLDEKGNSKPIIMGSYGIGLERIMACACEQKSDDRGAVWPISIAPFDIHLTILNPHEDIVSSTSKEAIELLTKAEFSVIIDDRDISAGIKFNDADLIGIPIRITVGPKGIKNNQLDICIRETGEIITASKTELVTKCIEIRDMLYRRING
ncbi:MAG: proline--tRNA ligase [candidate division WOR-3 bacterium]|nr:MAG: proline--tRNA ligase [candidate division WOR-3 bacterium]